VKAVETILGDCLEVLADIPSDSVDAVLTDPPYGCQDKNQVQAHGVNEGGGRVEGFKIAWNFDLPLEYLNECARVLKPGGSLVTFTDNKKVETVWNYVESTGLRPLQTFYWLKTNPPPQPRKNFQSAVETAVFARKAGKIIHWGGGGASKNYIETPIAMGNDRTAHPTQKHVEVFQYLIRALCPQGGIVLDPFGGSGTTGVAALLEGRRALLIEKSPEYFKIMNERLLQWQQSDRVRQFHLFGG
jgi:DNA modification methylase